MVAGVLSLLAFLLVIPLNGLTKWLAVVALFIAGSYPFFKRFFAIPQAYLGIAFGFGIPMAFAAVQGKPVLAWVMLVGNVFWAVAYDTAYAMVDRDDDLLIGIKTSAITFGRFDVAAIMICYAVFLGLMAWAGLQLALGWPLLGRAGGGGGLHGVPLHADPRTRAHAVLRRLPPQQLAGCVRVCRGGVVCTA